MPTRLVICVFLSAFALNVRADNSVLAKGTNLTSLVVIERSDLGDAPMQTLMASLQGLVARSSSEQIYFNDCCGYSLWLDHLRDHYGVPSTPLSDPWTVLNRFKHLLNGYILYDRSNPDSVNAATSLCGPLNAIAVDRTLEPSVRANGITNRVADVSTRDESWTWANYAPQFSRRIVVEQEESKYFHLRDYAVMANAFTFSDGNSAFRTSVMRSMDPDAAVLGWGTGGENSFVGDSSRQGVFTVPSDWALNLSTLSSVREDSLYQRTYSNPVTEPNVHYVTFIATDGDNVQWDLGGFPAYYNHPARGDFDMGWALSPSLADLAPSVLRWYYASASNSPGRDFFIAGPSGNGYLYPSMYPPAELDLHVARLDSLMAHADLNIVQIIDFNSFNRLDLWDKYTAQPNIAALIYLEFAPYNGAHGAIAWSNGKPVIGAREMLWDGLSGADEASVINHLNNAPRTPSSPDGYSLVAVHVWSKDLGNVKTVVNSLAPEVRVVTPDVFVKLIQANLGNTIAFNFANGLQGWSGAISGKPFDKAQWTAAEGNGSLLFDGSDLGTPNSSPNAWFSRQVVLPPNAVSLRFQTRAVNDGELRVRLQLPDSTFLTLLDWESLPDGNWVLRSANLEPYAGQTVKIFFEQNDGGQGSGEYRYVDDVEITTAGPAPNALPAAPKLLDAYATSDLKVDLVWRDNSVNEFGFAVERKQGATNEWAQIAFLPANATTYTDSNVNPGQLYSYRVQARSGAGTSAYSAERSVAIPSLDLSVRRFGRLVIIQWPAVPGFVAQSTTNFAPATAWSTVTETIDTNGNFNTLRFFPPPGSRFFRVMRASP